MSTSQRYNGNYAAQSTHYAPEQMLTWFLADAFPAARSTLPVLPHSVFVEIECLSMSTVEEATWRPDLIILQPYPAL